MQKKLKILAVDDEPDALELYKDLFTQKGYNVECAPGGIEAIKSVGESDIDAVLLDIRMPNMDGIETLVRLKERSPELPIVMLTAYGYDENLINKALQLGAIGYISKNLPLAQIVHTFQTLLSTVHRKEEPSK